MNDNEQYTLVSLSTKILNSYNFMHSKLTHTLDRPGELFSKQVSEKNIVPGFALTYNYFQTCNCMDGVKCLQDSELMKEPLTYM